MYEAQHIEVTVWRAGGGDDGENFVRVSPGHNVPRRTSGFKPAECGNSTQLLAVPKLSERDGEAEIKER